MSCYNVLYVTVDRKHAAAANDRVNIYTPPPLSQQPEAMTYPTRRYDLKVLRASEKNIHIGPYRARARALCRCRGK